MEVFQKLDGTRPSPSEAAGYWRAAFNELQYVQIHKLGSFPAVGV
jgi:hypothetical protein